MSESSTETSAAPGVADQAISVATVAENAIGADQVEERQQEQDETDKVAQLTAESRKWEKRAKENAAAAKKLAEIEDAKKSEIERAQGKQQRAEAERDEAVAKLLRYEVATRVGLPASVAHRLQGSTSEELEADARELAKLLADKKEAQRKENLVDPSAGRGADSGATTADQFAALFNK